VTNIRYLSGFRAANFLAKFFILRPQKSTKNVTPKTQYFCFLSLKVSSCLFHARASPDELCDCLYRIHRYHFREFSTPVCQKWSIFEVFSNFSVSGSNPFRKPLPRLIMVKIREKHQKTAIFEITTFGGLFDKEKPR